MASSLPLQRLKLKREEYFFDPVFKSSEEAHTRVLGKGACLREVKFFGDGQIHICTAEPKMSVFLMVLR
jgi:hypothetical protein